MALSRPERIEPGPGQESVWDYPRPPRLDRTSSRVRVEQNGVVIADSTTGWRVLETSQAPGYYLPPADVNMQHLQRSSAQSFCEWKGLAAYFDFVSEGAAIEQVGWYYPEPTAPFAEIANHVAFYPQKVQCSVDGELVDPNGGSFYGGWITSKVVGPFKGDVGSQSW